MWPCLSRRSASAFSKQMASSAGSENVETKGFQSMIRANLIMLWNSAVTIAGLSSGRVVPFRCELVAWRQYPLEQNIERLR